MPDSSETDDFILTIFHLLVLNRLTPFASGKGLQGLILRHRLVVASLQFDRVIM
jgi:hypothetical protein